MTTPTIFETCRPRDDVLAGTVTEADFAADLATVISGKGADIYTDPVRFFANTYPTRGLKNLLTNVCSRLSGTGGETAAIFRLDTSYGGGKTHGLIALCHAAHSGLEVPNISEFVNPELIPSDVQIAAFEGENADPSNGRRMLEGHLAFTPWGEIASKLAGQEGYDRVRTSDEKQIAPGAETLRELFGGRPTLILLDELSVYLRKVGRRGNAREQFTAFLHALIKAVESSPNSVLVFTLAIGKDGLATDAYSDENQFIADQMSEIMSVSARKSTLLNPTEDDETIQVLRRRLFEDIDEKAADVVLKAYRKKWDSHRNDLPDTATQTGASEDFRSGYPLHPEVLETLTKKTATLGKFQRVRGMLRVLAHTVAHLWAEKPPDATAIHLHHIDLGYEPVKQEFITRLEHSEFAPAITNDLSAGQSSRKALAERLDDIHHSGLPPYASYVARTIFIHSFAFNLPLQGVSKENLRYSILGPTTELSFIEEARNKFIAESAYLDDRPDVPMRFVHEANLNQMIRRTENLVDAGDVRTELNSFIRGIFKDKTLDLVLFPSGPFDVTDDVANGSPKLVIIGYDALAITATDNSVPELLRKIYENKGSNSSELRLLRNNLIFIVADETYKDEMHQKASRKLALRDMLRPERQVELADYQQEKVRSLYSQTELQLPVAIQQCYRHVFYPSNRTDNNEVNLAHTAIDLHSASDKPGNGQQQVVRALQKLNKLRLPRDDPDSPNYVRDRTPLKKGEISVLALRDEFRRNPGLPILIGEDTFFRGIQKGIEDGDYVYQRGELLCGPGDPGVKIEIDDQSMILTMSFAKNEGIWPRSDLEENEEEEEEEQEEEEEEEIDDVKVITAEGTLTEAFVKIWEKARSHKLKTIGVLEVRMYDSDAFRLLSSVNSVSDAEKTVKIRSEYKTSAGGKIKLKFKGPISDAKLVQEFLAPQLRDAISEDIVMRFELIFETGLSMDGNVAEDLAKQLCRFVENSPAFISASKAKVNS